MASYSPRYLLRKSTKSVSVVSVTPRRSIIMSNEQSWALPIQVSIFRYSISDTEKSIEISDLKSINTLTCTLTGNSVGLKEYPAKEKNA
jgi:hypothetical protein